MTPEEKLIAAEAQLELLRAELRTAHLDHLSTLGQIQELHERLGAVLDDARNHTLHGLVAAMRDVLAGK